MRFGFRGAIGAVAGVALVLMAGVDATAAEPPNGLYLRTRFAFGSINMDTFLFKDGQVAQDPAGGIANFDFAKAKAASPGSVGTYKLAGGTLSVTWANGQSTESSYEKKDGPCFSWAGTVCPVKAFGKGERLEGTFTGGASAGGGAVSSSRTLTLGKDGRYTLSGGGVVAPGGNVAGAVGSFGKEEGSYDLSGNTLTLKPSGGQPARTVLTFPYDDGTKGDQPRRLYFDGVMLKRS